MAESLWGYPTDFMPAATVLIKKLRGDDTIPTVEALHAAWHLAGYALSHFDDHAPKTGAALSLVSANDLAGMLSESLSRRQGGLGISSAAAWQAILWIVWEMQRRLLEERA